MRLSVSRLALLTTTMIALCFAHSSLNAQCCQIRGDIDHSDSIPDLMDVMYLAEHIFNQGPAPQCVDEADVNFDGYPGDISDIVMLADYIFQGGIAPADCDSCWVEITRGTTWGGAFLRWDGSPNVDHVEISYRSDFGGWISVATIGRSETYHLSWPMIGETYRACAVGFPDCCDQE